MSTVDGLGVQELGAIGNGGSGQQGDASVLVAGDIQRLQAFDGLFLRAEHLNAIQDYAEKLATAIGAAGGPGVVEGYDLTLNPGQLVVGPGLAIDGFGRPLLSIEDGVLSLTDLPRPQDRFWYVEAVAAAEPAGNEPVQGLLCDEPCGAGTTRAPYLAQGVLLRLTPAVQTGLQGWAYEQRRSRLTSKLFADEERRAGAWSRDPADPTARLADRSWLPPRVAAGADPAVRLGLLIPDGDQQRWQLDVWGARRDRGASPPTRAWQWRLAMRPWDVFVAQVLQFQDMLGYSAGSSLTEAVLRRLDEIAESIPQERQTKARSAALVSGLREYIAGGGPTGEALSAAAGVPLVDRGIVELPPAGFLPYEGTAEGTGAAMRALLGDGVRLRVCTCRPVDVAQAVQQAQHRDRIPLGGTQRPADVDVLLPVTEDGYPAFDWVAFVRRDATVCGSPAPREGVDEVDVRLLDVKSDEQAYKDALARLAKGTVPDAALELGRLEYPARTWAVPEGHTYAGIYGNVEKLQGPSELTAVALVRAEERRPLGAVRAALLSVTFTSDGVESADVRSYLASGDQEAIVILARTRAETPGETAAGTPVGTPAGAPGDTAAATPAEAPAAGAPDTPQEGGPDGAGEPS